MEDFQKRINRVARKTWEAVREVTLLSAELDEISQEQVIETVSEFLNEYGDDQESLAVFHALDEASKRQLLRKAFPLARYGW